MTWDCEKGKERFEYAKYRNLGGDSEVKEFGIGKDYITVGFYKSPRLYTYSYARAGKEKGEHMKRLAINSQELNEFLIDMSGMIMRGRCCGKAVENKKI